MTALTPETRVALPKVVYWIVVLLRTMVVRVADASPPGTTIKPTASIPKFGIREIISAFSFLCVVLHNLFMADSVERWFAPLEAIEIDEFQGYSGRRRKAALTLTVLWGSTIALHLFSWGGWVVMGLTMILSTHALRILCARPWDAPLPLPTVKNRNGFAEPAPDCQSWPFVSLLVAAKNEEAVIARLVETLCDLDYPTSRYEVWVVDDNSSDQTLQILQKLTKTYPSLRVLQRGGGATGGKSGALNQVWPDAQGDIIGVFDADARVPQDLLRRMVPIFDQPEVGAVQVRKAIINRAKNLWTRGQQAEMALDSFFQQQRIAVGGIGELRGNGQFVRRQALEQCGGWNEETITDDLDLTMRLHFSGWGIQLLLQPPVGEEGVEGGEIMFLFFRSSIINDLSLLTAS